MSNRQKILFGCSFLSCFLVLFSFFFLNSWVTLILFIVHSLLLLPLAPLLFRKNRDNDQFIEPETSCQKPAADSEAKAASVTEKLNEQTRLYEEKSLELFNAEQRILALEVSLAQLQTGSQISAIEKNLVSSQEETTKNADESTDILNIAKTVMEEFAQAAEHANIKLILSAQEKAMPVAIRKEHLFTLFRNLIQNSLQYMGHSGTLLITVSNTDDNLFLAFKDNGLGLSESETLHIFEPHYQGSNCIGGEGLGLSQVKSIVDSYNGFLYAKSSIGKGMGIYIQFPHFEQP